MGSVKLVSLVGFKADLWKYEPVMPDLASGQTESMSVSPSRHATAANERFRAVLHWSYWPLIGVMLVAAGLRLWKLNVLPPGLYHDEAINGVDARMVLSGAGLPLYFAANNGREPLFIYLQMVSAAILGANPYALRLVSALIGILTVPANCAQSLASTMVEAGVHAIWNFSPVKIMAPQDVIVQHENLASSLVVLSKKLEMSLKSQRQ